VFNYLKQRAIYKIQIHKLLEEALRFYKTKMKTKVMNVLSEFANNRVLDRAKYEKVKQLSEKSLFRRISSLWIQRARKIIKHKIQKSIYKTASRKHYFKNYLNKWFKSYKTKIDYIRKQNQAIIYYNLKALNKYLKNWKEGYETIKWKSMYSYINKSI